MRLPRTRCRQLPLVLLAILLLSIPAAAQTETSEPAQDSAETATSPWRTSGSDRLFLGFAREATVIGDQWWEGRAEFAEGDDVDAILGRFVFAVQPLYQLEVGGTVGFGSTRFSGDLPNGSGATDLEAWLKYYLGSAGGSTEFAIGGTLTVPTGDDSAGLGEDSWAVSLFGSMRYSLRKLVIGAYLGTQYNQDGRYVGVDLDGKISFQAGGSVIYPIADPVTLVGEVVYESARFDDVFGLNYDGAIGEVLGGVNWRVTNRGQIRASVSFGFQDASPDFRVLAGYAWSF